MFIFVFANIPERTHNITFYVHLAEIARMRPQVANNPVNVKKVGIIPGIIPPRTEEQDQRESQPTYEQKRDRY
jgi:hypothetical protein